MRLSSETYIRCPVCGTEANGLDDINKVFGYKIVKEVIQPYSECRKCRGDFKEQVHQAKQWATAASWGRRIYTY